MQDGDLNTHAVDCTSMVTPCARLHVLHGGNRDDAGIQAFVSHLQQSWCAAVVHCSTGAHLRSIAETIDRVPSAVRLIVCVPLGAVAAAPDAYDALTMAGRGHDTTCVVTIPLSKLTGAPYSKRSDITVVVLPSARLDMDNVHTAAAVYRFPSVPLTQLDAGRCVDECSVQEVAVTTTRKDEDEDKDNLDGILWVLPHEFVVAWMVGRSARPSVLDVTNPVAVNRRKLRDAQGAADRAWWWSRDLSLKTGAWTSLPSVLAGLAGVKGFPFTPARDPCYRRISDDTLAFNVVQTREQLYALRAAQATSSRMYDVHVLDDTDAVTPVQMCLNTTVDATSHAGVVTVTCKCSFPREAVATNGQPACRRTWKAYAGVL